MSLTPLVIQADNGVNSMAKNSLPQPKFSVGQQVKFVNDHDGLTGKVLSLSFHSANVTDEYTGFEYRISSRYYDAALNEMAEGYKLCKEEELVDMSKYKGGTGETKPDKTVNLSDGIKT
jgi:hypothetical protein